MGADRFIAFYGLRFQLTADADEIDDMDEGSDPRFVAAKQGKLHHYVGRLTDGEPFFLFIGKSFGIYGVENKHERALSIEEIENVATETRETLRRVGLEGTPQLWFQLEAQY